MDDLYKTIDELKSSIASYEKERASLLGENVDSSTPKTSVSQDTVRPRENRESRPNTANTYSYTPVSGQLGAEAERYRTSYSSPSDPTFSQRNVIVSETDKNRYDLSPYLPRQQERYPPPPIDPGVQQHSEPRADYRTGDWREGRDGRFGGEGRRFGEEDRRVGGIFQDRSDYRRHLNSVKPATFDGTGSWIDYKAHFEACALLNNWDETEKALYLAVSLRGQSQGVLGNLPGGAIKKYTDLITALDERFAPPNQMELYRAQLRERRQKATETLPELGQSIRRLTNQAYSTAPVDVIETLAKEQFIDALIDSDMRIRIKQARPANLNEAIRHAVELEAFIKAEQKRKDAQGFMRPVGHSEKKASENEVSSVMSTLQKLTTSMDRLQREIKDLKTKREHRYQTPRQEDDWRKRAQCHNCGKKGHIKRDCPTKDVAINSNAPQAIASDKTTAGKLGVNRQVGDAGIFVKVDIDNLEHKFLVDTGATVTLLSKEAFDHINRADTDSKFTLSKVSHEILSASDEPLEVWGKTVLPLKIGSCLYNKTVVVSKLSVDGVIGLDFMMAHKCSISLVSQTMQIDSEEVKLLTEGAVGCYRVSLADTLNIPPRSEMVVNGAVHLPKGLHEPKGSCIIEGDETFLTTGGGLVGKSLVSQGQFVPVRIMNPTPEVRVIHAGTVVGTMTPVDRILAIDNAKTVTSTQDMTPALQDLYERTSEGLSKRQKAEIRALLVRNAELFAKDDKDFGRTDVVKHSINTGNQNPIKQPLRRLPVHTKCEVDKHIDEMLERGVIEPSSSPWACGIVLVQKKDGSTRFCVDYRRLNAATIKDAYPLPRIDESLDHLSGACWFSTLDLCSGYWQVEMEPEDKPKTAFVTKRGLFQFTVMPFGLCNAPATFERLMETVLNGLQWEVCLIYLDDIIVIGKSFEEMMSNLEKVFNRLFSAGLKLKAKKCHLFSKEVQFLGHIVNADGVSTDPSKVETVREWPEPVSVTEVRSFLGLCSYYRRFIRNFADIARPLHKLTQKGAKFKWTKECQDSFENLKYSLTHSPVLAFPDFTKPFILDTDASDQGIGSVLSQMTENGERVVAYGSRVLSKSERKYCVTRKELLAVVTYVKYFRHFLYGKPFLIRTDHSSLRWLLNMKNPEGQLARWLEVLSMYHMTIEHRPGTQHRNADAMSRRPCKQCNFDPDWETSVATIAVSQAVPKPQDDSASEVSIKELQKNDVDIAKVKDWLERSVVPGGNDISAGGTMLRSLWSQRGMLVIVEDILYRNWRDANGSTLQAIVPMSERRNVLQYCHDHKTAGHLGVTKTLSKIRQSYYWPGLQRDVRQYIAGCDTCTRRKCPTKTNRAPMQIVRSGLPMERIALDILGELPITDNGNRYILVISDYFTKWTEAFPMPNMEAKTVVDILTREVIARFGVPSIIHSDQGRQFESQIFSEMCAVLQIHKTRTTPYHPQSDGMVERFNKTLATMLSAYVNEHHSDWDEHLPFVLMAYRSVEHETTGSSPNYMMLGREVSTPLDIMYEMPTSIKSIPANKWAWELQERLESAHAHVRHNVEGEMMRQKSLHDRKLSWQTFKAGDQVYVYFPRTLPGRSPKFTSFWRGPYTVVEKCSEVTYKVRCGQRDQVQVIHVDRMRQKKDQSLRNESSGDADPCSQLSSDSAEDQTGSENVSGSSLVEEDQDTRPTNSGRTRRPPLWMSDYVTDY